MKNFARAILVTSVLVVATAAHAQPAVPGRVLVKLRDASVAPQSFVATHAGLGLESARALFPKELLRGGRYRSESVERTAPLARWIVVELRDRNADGEATARALRQLADVEWAEPDYIAHILESEPVASPHPAALHPQTNLTVNDPRFADQWALTYVHAPAAWDITQGSSSQVIAIIDTGIDLDHPDLASKIYVNPHELIGDANGDGCPGICGVDDDGDGFVDEGSVNDDDENGYVDDLKGWNFVANTNNAQDDNGHGSHAAGIAAAATNNGIGIAGACPLCMLMPLKAFDASGNGASSNIAAAITYAWRNGATVISMSFEQSTDAQVMRDAAFAAYNGDARSPGVVLVGAAGNHRSSKTTAFCSAAGIDLPVAPSYPGAYPFVLGVEAGDNTGALASFSNCQYPVRDPGVGIVSTYFNDTYLSLSGTSMAAPLAAGIAGLVRANNATWTPGQVFSQIKQAGGDALSSLTNGPQPRMEYVSATVTDAVDGSCSVCNNDGFWQPGETLKIVVTVHNGGSAQAFGVNGTLTSSNPDVTLTTASTTWGAVGPNVDDDDADNPLRVTIGAGATHGEQIQLSLTVTLSNGDGQSGLVQTITIPVTTAIVKSGPSSGNETWTPDHLYTIPGPFQYQINPGDTLTILPGTHVVGNSPAGGYLNVQGNIIAVGTASNPIVFDTQISVPATQLDANGDYVSGPRFEYCIFQNTRGPLLGVAGGGKTYLRKCIIRKLSIYGNPNALVQGGGTADSCLFTDNENVYTFSPATSLILRHDTIVGNWNLNLTSIDDPAPSFKYCNFFSNQFVSFITAHDATLNYWGSTDPATIERDSIYDKSDNPFYAVAQYQPFLSDPDPDAPGCVKTIAMSPPSPLGAQRVTFTVTFSRDMDQTASPVLTFGPQSPYDQRKVTLNAHWIDTKNWSADYNFNKTTGDGNYKISLSGAKDLEGFPIPSKDYRFGFEVITSGTSSAQLNATGFAGRIDLAWNAADPNVYPTLAGYNIYRGGSSSGPFTKINGALVSDIAYSDSTALPGVVYYYVYRIVDSDNSESPDSDVASAAALDNVPPVITHSPVTSAPAGQILTIQATMTDNIAVTAGRLFYRPLGSANTYTQLNMINASGSTWSINIPSTDMTAPGIEYYLEATDGVTTVQHGTPATPHQVTVVDRPSITSLDVTHGPLTGNTLVTLTGTNFQNGAAVTFGGSAATNVVINSAQSLTCRTPAHYPKLVDVTVTNSNSGTGTLLRSYTFDGTQTTLQLPTTGADRTSTFNVTVSTPGVDGAIAATFEFTYDSSVLSLQSVSPGSLNGTWGISSNTSTAGTVRISLAGSTPVTGAGSLASIAFQVNGNPDTSSPLTWSQATLNDGVIPITTQNGQLNVNNSFTVAGSVSYYNASRPISGATMTLAGASSYSQASAGDGSFSIQNVPSDNYVLSAAKSDGVIANSISALDASYVLQHDAHVITLSAAQQTAADVNGSGTVTALDATEILEYVAALRTLPFDGAGKVWSFSPATRLYNPLLSNQSAQAFTGTLIGDPTGNWNAGGAGIPSPLSVPGTMSLAVGNIVTCNSAGTIPVDITAIDTSVHAVELRITYDSTKMTVSAVRAGTLANGWVLVANTNQPGLIRIAMAGAAPISTTGSLLQIDFTNVIAPGGSLTVSSPLFDEGEISASVSDGSLLTCPAGDVNGDGLANTKDIFVLINRIFGGGGAPSGNTDINHDSAVNGADVDYLVSYQYGSGPAPTP